MAEGDKQQNIQNDAPNQGAQGTFHGPVNFDQRQTSGDVTVHGSVIGTGIAIGHNNVVQVTTVYEWARKQPADPQTVEAGRLLLDQLPTAALPELAALPPGSQMPFFRTPAFVGREVDLLTVAATLKGGQTTAIGQAASVHGLGGVGKTTVATEFVHRYGGYFAGGVFWLSFAEPMNIPAQVAKCGGEGGLQLRPDFHNLPLKDQVAAVQRAWSEEIPRLLVFDNVDTEDAEKLVHLYRPTMGGCRVLITSRRSVWSKTLGIASLPLGVLNRKESIDLLRQLRADLSDADANAIAEELGDLPLALYLAGSYLSAYSSNPRLGNPQHYLAQLQEKQLEHSSMVGKSVEVSPTDHELNVRATFALSYERLDTTTPIDGTAHTLLIRSACFAPGEPIPHILLLRTLPSARDEQEDEAEERKEDALRRLHVLGLLERLEREEGSALTLHRLLSFFVHQTVLPDDLNKGKDSVYSVIRGLLVPQTDHVALRQIDTIQEHVLHITTARLAYFAHKRNYNPMAFLLRLLNSHLQRWNIQQEMLSWYDVLEQIIKEKNEEPRIMDQERKLLIQILTDRGSVAMQQHNYDNAKKDYFEAAEIADRSEEAGLIGGAYGNLAAAYNALGDHFKALKLYNKALELAHKDANVSQLVKWYTNRGDIQTRLGDLGSALADTQKARECLNAVPPHNGIEMTQLRAIIRCQDGVIYYLRGQVRDALIAHQEVLPTAQKLNDKRLEVRSCSNIGGCYTALHASEGENWLNRALNLCSTSPSLAELAPSVHYFLAEWFLNKSECDLQRAQQHIYNGLEQAQQYNDLIYQHRCLTLLSELVLLQNNAAEAASFLDDAVAMQSIPSLYIAPAVTLRGIAYLLISHHEEAVNAFNDAKSLTKPMCDATVPPLLALHTYVTAWCGLACCGVTAAGDALEAMLARTWNQTTEHKLAANRLVRWLTLVQQIDTYKCLTPFHMHFTVSGSSREE